jgi:hypothetical protein
MEELTIDGKTYLSSKRAAKVTGYAKDYIGQLCREGRVEAKLVGRAWYVYQPSLEEHRQNDERVKKAKKGEESLPQVGFSSPFPSPAPEETAESAIESVWEAPSYVAEEITEIPSVAPKEELEQELHAPVSVSEMQAEWQEWFKQKEEKPIPPVREVPAPLETMVELPKAEVVPVHRIVSDIAPLPVREEAVSVKRSPQRAPTSKKRQQKAPATSKALLIAFTVIAASITLIATGLLEVLHLGSSVDFGILNYFEGINVVEK